MPQIIYFIIIVLFIKEFLQRIMKLSAAHGGITTTWRMTETFSNSRPRVITSWPRSAKAAMKSSTFSWDGRSWTGNPLLAKSSWSWTAQWWSSLKLQSASTANREPNSQLVVLYCCYNFQRIIKQQNFILENFSPDVKKVKWRTFSFSLVFH